MRHPVALVAIITGQIIQFIDAIDVDRTLNHSHRQIRADRQVLEFLVVSNLVNRRNAVVNNPKLRRGGFFVYVSYA